MYLVCVAKKYDDMLWDWVKSRFISPRPARLGLLYLFIIGGQCHTRPLTQVAGVLGCCTPVVWPTVGNTHECFRHAEYSKPNKYAPGLRFVVFCCDVVPVVLHISITLPVQGHSIRQLPYCQWNSPIENEFTSKGEINRKTQPLQHDVHILWAILYMHYMSLQKHCSDVMMASQITSLTIVYSTVYSGTHQRKLQSSASLAFVRGIHWWPANSPHKWPVTRKMFPFDDVIIMYRICCWYKQHLSGVHRSDASKLYTSACFMVCHDKEC